LTQHFVHGLDQLIFDARFDIFGFFFLFVSCLHTALTTLTLSLWIQKAERRQEATSIFAMSASHLISRFIDLFHFVHGMIRASVHCIFGFSFQSMEEIILETYHFLGGVEPLRIKVARGKAWREWLWLERGVFLDFYCVCFFGIRFSFIYYFWGNIEVGMVFFNDRNICDYNHRLPFWKFLISKDRCVWAAHSTW
jgi:hypothetical protein